MRSLTAALSVFSFWFLAQTLTFGTAIAAGGAGTEPRTFDENREVAERVCEEVGTTVCLTATLALITVHEFEAAEALAVRSCEGGDPLACMLAGLAGAGQGKFGIAIDGYGRACDGGVAVACPMLGDMLVLGVRAMEPGWSFERGWSEALSLFHRACDLGDSYGCRRAASIYSGGLGVPRQQERAASFRRKACALGDSDACSTLN